MAVIYLYRDEVSDGLLQPICLRCGAPAVLTRNHTFACHPRWVDLILLGLLAAIFVGLFAFLVLLVWVIVALATTSRMRFPVPFCEAHKNHLAWRRGYVYAGTAFFALVGTAALALVVIVGRKECVADLIGFLCALPAGIGLAWLMSALIIQNGSITATEITPHGIRLCRVSRAFVDAVEETDAQAEKEYYREKRRHYENKDEGIYDPETSRRHHPRSEGYREGKR